jgi:hypothetical protein
MAPDPEPLQLDHAGPLGQWLLITCRLLTRKLDASTAQPALRRTGDDGKSTGNLRTKVARHRRNQLIHGFAPLATGMLDHLGADSLELQEQQY